VAPDATYHYHRTNVFTEKSVNTDELTAASAVRREEQYTMPSQVRFLVHWLGRLDIPFFEIVIGLIVAYLIANIVYSAWLTRWFETQRGQRSSYAGFPPLCKVLDRVMFIKSTDVLRDEGLKGEIDLGGTQEE